MVDVVERPTTKYIVFPGPSEQELRETIGWETAGRRQARDPARWTSITGQLYDPHTQEQPQLVVRRMDEPDSTQVAFSGGGGFLLERNEGMQETYPDDEEITYEANETTTLDTTAPDTSTSAVIWSATQPLPTNLVQNPSINYSQFLHATPSQYLTQTVDAPQLRFNPIEITPLDSTRERMWLSENEKPFINILAAIIALEHPKETSGMPRTTWTLGDFTGATIRVTLFGNAVGWNPFVKVGDVIHLTKIGLSVYNDSIQGTGGDRSTLEIAHRIMAETEEDEMYVLLEEFEEVIPAVKAALTIAKWYQRVHLPR